MNTLTSNLNNCFEIIKDVFIGAVFDDETLHKDNGGAECHAYMTFTFRLGVTLFTLFIYYLIYSKTLKTIQKELSSDSKQIHSASTFESILGYLTIILFFVHCLYKIKSRQFIFIMNPCHMVGLVEGYLLISPNGLKQRTIYTVLMNTLFSPWTAIIFPFTLGLTGPYEIPLFWIEHILAALINPLVLSLTHRFYTKTTITLRNHLFSHCVFGLYQRVVLFPLSQLTHANLNFTLCGAASDPFESFIGKWYYLFSDFYLFFGGEVFHRLIKLMLGIINKVEGLILKHSHNVDGETEKVKEKLK